jgi:hypothetical protein
LRLTDAEPESRQVNARSWLISGYWAAFLLRAISGCGTIARPEITFQGKIK